MNFEALHLRLDSILDRKLSSAETSDQSTINVVGCSSALALAALVVNSNSKHFNKLPHLIIVNSLSDAQRLVEAITFFDPTRSTFVLSEFDISPYSGLEPKPSVVQSRLAFLNAAQNMRTGSIFISTLPALIQRTIPFQVLSDNTYPFKVGDDFWENPAERLHHLGYTSSPQVEDVGHYSIRGGIIDVFSPAHKYPVRIELFGDSIQSMRHFTTSEQRSVDEISTFTVIPCREFVWDDELVENALSAFRESTKTRDLDEGEPEEILRSLSRKSYFPGIEFCIPFFYKKLSSPLEHFSSALNVFFLDLPNCERSLDQFVAAITRDFRGSTRQTIRPDLHLLFAIEESFPWPEESRKINFRDLEILSDDNEGSINYRSHSVLDLTSSLSGNSVGSEAWLVSLKKKFTQWLADDYKIFIGLKNKTQAERLKLYFEKIELSSTLVSPDDYTWDSWVQNSKKGVCYIIPRAVPESIRLPEESLIFIRDEDLLGKKSRVRGSSATDDFQKKANRLAFGDLKPGDCIVHSTHGIGIYEGLKLLPIGGVDAEFIQIAYKDKDKLYLPVYRVGQLQKFSGAGSTAVLDKLGGTGWEKTKSKVRNQLKDIAADLLQLYAKRSQLERPMFSLDSASFASFEEAFPYDETEDQDRAISDIVSDMQSPRPMDRLICGDVGYGKTEVAMRAAFIAAMTKKQVAILSPTTILSFQHFETFRKRFSGWPIEVRELNRFVTPADQKKTLAETKAGKVDILIGTHRILSKDVSFKDLGLLIVDEEQKFGVVHKEKIRQLKNNVDTLTLSATPIPRTLNMSLVGIRDLSLINTAPVDRLPTRTFICKWDDEIIRKGIESEIERGGQVYFIHNRVQSIYGIVDEIRKIVPTARIAVGHGQLEEDVLEKVMISFFNHEIDVLVCTTIVESGMDVSRANTMFVDHAHMMGLSQLYQLRGRVGRSKQRAYCYLMLPRNKHIEKDAQERLKILQDNTALGSGIRIAQYDLELRGAGNILGADQSGQINSVGYEMYMDLLEEAVGNLRGDPLTEFDVEPDINLRIPALLPETYIKDIRLRLSYYKALADVRSPDDVDRIESELKDQFGELPEPVLNLLGVMLIRSECKKIGIKDVSAGLKNVSFTFAESTKMKPETAIQLAMRENKKYSITPDSRLNVRMNIISWPAIYDELIYLGKMV